MAEQFLMLAGLHPGLVGGRSVGFTEPVRRALRRAVEEPDTFADDLREMRSYLDRTAPVTARPVVDETVPVFVLATGQGIRVAAELGAPVVLGAPCSANRTCPTCWRRTGGTSDHTGTAARTSPSPSTCWSQTRTRGA